MLAKVCCLLIGYCFGLLQTGYLYGKFKGIDIRSVGSGNAGTTNMLRTLGPGAGLITLLCDAFKTVLAMLVSWLIFHKSYPEMVTLLELYAGAGAVLGHDFPFYMHFKGGKGIACTAGLVIGLHNPILFVLGFITFFGIFFTTHYVSLGSLMIYLGLVVESIIMGENGIGNVSQMAFPNRLEFYIILIALMALAYYQHRANIVRLFTGCERRTYLSKEKNKAEAERYNKMMEEKKK
ncbi:MAG: glycerol-3-phosphate acyltransferase [Lachnospiraceae bacterium]|nr:glycerol-3-phosphate acyltransferase [Lachnospiraceae bacterium]